MAYPRPKGKAIPAVPTLSATFQLLAAYRRSTSKPTKKRKSTNPKFATRVRLGILAVGKMASEKPGMRPMTEGPSKIPPTTSAMTRGLARTWRRNICTHLDNEQDDRVFGIIVAWIPSFQNPALRRGAQSAGCAGRGYGLGNCLRHQDADSGHPG
nr:hypothetical protein CFP56_71700 [Quercus suber]